MTRPPQGVLLARLDAPTSREPTRIAVISDPHVRPGAATERHLRRAVADVNTQPVDAVIFTGDLSDTGRQAEFNAFDAVVEELAHPMYAIPGNHDIPEADDPDALSFRGFVDRYASGGYPFVERIGGIDLVGLDSSGKAGELRESGDGRIGDEDLSWLDRTLGDLEQPIVALHHNLPAITARYNDDLRTLVPDQAAESAAPVLRNPEPVVDVLARHDASIVLTGHLHYPSYAESRGVPEVTAPSTGPSFPRAYLVVESGPDGTTVRCVPIGEYRQQLEALVERRDLGAGTRAKVSMAAVTLASAPFGDVG